MGDSWLGFVDGAQAAAGAAEDPPHHAMAAEEAWVFPELSRA